MSTYPVSISLMKDAGQPSRPARGDDGVEHRAVSHDRKGQALPGRRRSGGFGPGDQMMSGRMRRWALIQTPQRLADGELNRDFVRNAAAGKKLQDSMYMLGGSGARYGSVVVSPLDLSPVETQPPSSFM